MTAEDGRPPVPDAVYRFAAFAEELGLTIEGLVDLLESYDLHLKSGPAPRQINRSEP